MKDTTAVLQVWFRARRRQLFDRARRHDVATGIRNYADLRREQARQLWAKRRNSDTVAA